MISPIAEEGGSCDHRNAWKSRSQRRTAGWIGDKEIGASSTRQVKWIFKFCTQTRLIGKFAARWCISQQRKSEDFSCLLYWNSRSVIAPRKRNSGTTITSISGGPKTETKNEHLCTPINFLKFIHNIFRRRFFFRDLILRPVLIHFRYCELLNAFVDVVLTALLYFSPSN